MKKIKLSYLSNGAFSRLWMCVLGILFLNTACNDLLEEKPKSVAVETFYNTASEVESATSAIYPPLRSSNLSVYEATLECHTDYAYGRGSWAQMNDFQGLNDANINRLSPIWNAFYLSIRNANLVIKNAPNGKSISAADIAKYVGEAKFMRAYNYFQLVRNWGGVPLRTEENMFETDCPKSTTDDIYNLIVADLKEAEANLPDVQSNVGKPTKWAAKTLLADVYLQLGKNAEARDKANEVITSGKYSLVPVTSVSDFQNKVWGPNLSGTTEEIFYYKYTHQNGYQNYMLWIINHANTGAYNYGGAYAVYSNAINPFYVTWNDNDLRKQLWKVVNFGLGTTTLVSTKFIDSNGINNSGGGNDDPLYGYSDVLLIYAEAACRAANGPTEAAMEALNQVHRRAYGKDAKTSSSIDFKTTDYNTDSFITLVLREKAYEFQFGGKRWLDLKRTGKAKDVILATKGITVADKHMLWPIPLSEMNYNKALDPKKDQNPGY